MFHQINPSDHGPLGAEMASAVSTCVHCGFCLAACPTYRELGEEADSPRGRIILMKEVLEGTVTVEDAATYIDPCLGCLACEPACPSGVPYRDLISPFRALTEPQRKRDLGDRLRRFLAQATLPYPRRFRLAAKAGNIAKAFLFLVPKPLRIMLELLPPELPKKQSWQETYPAIGPRRARVALLTGCAQSVLDPDINTATIDVLTRNGVEVIVPQNQSCCGALSWHVGNLKQAQKFAANNLQAFPSDIDAVVTNAAGCGSGMHEYTLILKGTRYESQATAFCEKVIDVAAYLIKLGQLKAPVGSGVSGSSGQLIRVAYHDACHLSSAQGVRSQPRELLRMIPGVELCEIADAHLCCGSAGTYNMDQPEIAASLGKQKIENIIATNATVVATGNIGCMTQLKSHLQKQNSAVNVRHTIQLLRDAYKESDTNQ
jgi:glycolate oxidase iron-sulfur subunit